MSKMVDETLAIFRDRYRNALSTDKAEGRKMSTRTIIEINHDYVQDLADKNVIGAELYTLLCWAHSKEREDRFRINGIKVLAQRHHSEELNLKVR